MWWALAAFAAGSSELVVLEGALWPGRTATIEVASTAEADVPRADPPRLDATGGTLQGPEVVRPGVWRWRLTPGIDAVQVDLELDGAARSIPVAVPAAAAGPGLVVPDLVDVAAHASEAVFLIGGTDPPSVDALEVVAAEGTVTLAVTDRGVEVHLALDDRPYPRWVPVAVQDRRRNEQPVWVDVRVRARPRIPMVAERGAKLWLKVGGRSYGPFAAGPGGQIEGWVDQYPGDLRASALLVDDLGNETRTEVPLAAQGGPALLAIASDELLPGRVPPVVFVHAVEADRSAPKSAPTCRAPSGLLPTRSLGVGTWLVPLPSPEEPVDMRVACTLGPSVTEVRVPVTADVPVRIGLRIWPDELLADFPVADVSVVLDDARGERMGVGPAVEVRSTHGVVHVETTGGIVARGDYDGTAAIDVGEDRIEARYLAPPGEGPVEEVAVRWGAVPVGDGTLIVHGRALDRLRRPLGGIALTVGVDGGREPVRGEGLTGADGWATIPLEVWAVGRPLVVEASAGRARTRGLLLPGEAARQGPGEPDLSAVQVVHVQPGRVTGISIQLDPAVLRAGPGAVAWVYVRLEDGAGQPVIDEPVHIDVDEGNIGELRIRDDGTWVAEYTPDAAQRARQVEITARTSTVRSTARLDVEPRVVRMSIGPWVGARTNFGVMSAPTGGLQFDFRVRSRILGESAVLRLGGSATRLRSAAETGVGPSVEVRTTLVPLEGAILFRQDQGAFALWGGAGPLLGPQFTQVRFGNTEVARGQSWLLGAMVMVGAGVRVPRGEVIFQLQGSFLPAPKADVGYSGNLGSVSAGLGYRLVY